ncbi:hypothetical protein TRIP_C20077 [Candidatus Zixiibacteriota bacterium]|nr:hypothetical protein TRIP_C20077 [candidate division Zixibacteria bacterium]
MVTWSAALLQTEFYWIYHVNDTLFDRMERTDDAPADYSEPCYAYANRSNRPHIRKARTTLESWFREYRTRNTDSAKDLCQRFRSKDNAQHLAALTELYLHQLLLLNDFIPKVHPNLPRLSSRPEFFAFRDARPQFVLEAALVYDDKPVERINKFEANILDAIDDVNSPNFLVSVEIRSRDSKSQPKSSSIRRFLQNSIDKLDYHQVCLEYEESKILPQWTYLQEGWRLEFTALPVKGEACRRRTAESRVVGVVSRGAFRVNVDAAIRESVIAKSRKYGKFDMPFIIAVSVIREGKLCDDEIIMDALCGKVVVDYITNKDGTYQTKARRDLKGIWTDPKSGYANSHLSGVLFISGLTVGAIDTVSPVLWHHPQSDHPFDLNWLNIEQKYFDKESGLLNTYNPK